MTAQPPTQPPVPPYQSGQPYPTQPYPAHPEPQHPDNQYAGNQYPAGPYAGNQYAGDQYAPLPPKKKRKWPWIVGALVVLFVIIGVAGGGGDDDGGDTEAATAGTNSAGTNSAGTDSAGTDRAADEAADEESPASLNTPVRDGKFEFVVTDVEDGLDSVGDNPYLASEAQGQFVVVTMSVKNIGDEPQSFTPSAQKLQDTDGRTFESDVEAQLALESDIPLYDNINPGNTVEIKIVYDMPQNAEPATVELHDSMFSGGASVSLR